MGKQKKKKGLVLLLILLAVLMILLAAGGFGFSVAADKNGWGGSDDPVVVEIPSGAGLSTIADILHREGIIRYPELFRLEAEKDPSRIYQMGLHTLRTNMSYAEILDKLVQLPDGGISGAVKVTIPEGYEIRNIADELEEKGLIDREEFMDEIETGKFDYDFVKDIRRTENRLEGYLFPATYTFEQGVSEHDIINAMLQKFSEVVPPLYEQYDTDFSLDEIVTLASMIEREAADDSERGMVSSVFYNRMAQDMTLSSCATVQYILQERKTILSNEDIQIDSKYNTYRYKGLPVGPIASPGEASVRAALEPEQTDYLYFAAKMDGSGNVFSKTGEEHLQTVDQLQNGG